MTETVSRCFLPWWWHRDLPINSFHSYLWFHSNFPSFCLVLQWSMRCKSIILTAMAAQQLYACQGHKYRIWGCAVISSYWSGQGHPVCVYLEQAEIPGTTCRYELLPFQREKAGSSGLLVPLHCFWVNSCTLSWICCSASCKKPLATASAGFCIQGLSSHSAHKLLRTLAPFISSLDKIALKPWETAKSSDHVRWSELFLCPKCRLYRSS